MNCIRVSASRDRNGYTEDDADGSHRTRSFITC